MILKHSYHYIKLLLLPKIEFSILNYTLSDINVSKISKLTATKWQSLNYLNRLSLNLILLTVRRDKKVIKLINRIKMKDPIP
jgi:hypothetical protein